mmetsp:Transcript_3515/g.5395  ORF Transcript_3515/g.5395 Transcript_3515/m.5395 type:complete len:619 (+) Transcript_3515:92-1948(+)
MVCCWFRPISFVGVLSTFVVSVLMFPSILGLVQGASTSGAFKRSFLAVSKRAFTSSKSRIPLAFGSQWASQLGSRKCAIVSSASTPSPAWARCLSTDDTETTEPSSDGTYESVDGFFSPQEDFESIGITNNVLLERLQKMKLDRPSAVQAAAYNAIESGKDVTIGAETGSGKTFAYLLPILNDIINRKESAENGDIGYDYARTFVLVPNKELVQQVVRMAQTLCGGKRCLVYGKVDDSIMDDSNDGQDDTNVVRLAIMPGGLKEPTDFPPFRNAIGLGGKEDPVDIVISTPAALGPLALKPKYIDLFADVQTLVVDEADMLLDGAYIRQLNDVLMGFRRADRLDASHELQKTQHVFVAATLPDMGLKSVDAYLQKRFPYATRVTMAGMHNACHYGLSERTQWFEIESKKERMEKLTQLLSTPRDSDGQGLQGEKVIVFLNSVNDVDGANTALERAGLSTVPYHAKLPLSERTANLDKFRRYDPQDPDSDPSTVPILVSTDLASRGLDVPGVTAVVQLQFALNVVAHLHRMGRCGRAGKRDGRGIIFYSSQEGELVEVIRNAEQEQERMALVQDVDDIEDDEEKAARGTVKNAFSRKRAFTKKRKKARRNERSPAIESD